MIDILIAYTPHLHLFAIFLVVFSRLHIIHLDRISVGDVSGSIPLVVPVNCIQDQLRCSQRAPTAIWYLHK